MSEKTEEATKSEETEGYGATENDGALEAQDVKRSTSLKAEFESVDNVQSVVGFLGTLLGVCCGSIFSLILMIFLCALPIAMIVVGAKNLHNCPMERMIPIWLIVAGSFSLFESCVNFVCRCKNKDDTDKKKKATPNPLTALISLFLLAWFITGSVWVYRNWNPRPEFEDTTLANYCDKGTYMFSFVLITVGYGLMGLGLVFACCAGCCALCIKGVLR